MPDNFTAPITYFLQEGRENMAECLDVAFRAALQHDVRKIVIFTAKGAGVRHAIEKYLPREEYKNISLIAVTFPVGKRFTDEDGNSITVDISQAERELLQDHVVPIVRAHLPFDPIRPQFRDHGLLSQDLSLVGSALNIFGGSMSLCVQAIVLACDAGHVEIGEHVIALTSDTAILARATCTSRMLTELIVREILCKPVLLTIARKEQKTETQEDPIELQLPSIDLPEGPGQTRLQKRLPK